MEYRKKPVVIEAFKYGIDYVPDWFMDKVTSNEIITYVGTDIRDSSEYYCEIKTLEGIMRGNCGDYIIKGVQGEIYPCKPDIFEMTYEMKAREVEPPIVKQLLDEITPEQLDKIDKQMKQTAVKWLIDELEKYELYSKISYMCLGEIEIALDMEKEQIITCMSVAFLNGLRSGDENYKAPYEDWEQFYNETYGGDNGK